MKKQYRIWFVHNDEQKTRVDLGVTLGKYKCDGLGWTRAFQLVPKDNFGNLSGKIEFEEEQPVVHSKEVEILADALLTTKQY